MQTVPFAKRLGQRPEYASQASEMIHTSFISDDDVRPFGARRMAPR